MSDVDVNIFSPRCCLFASTLMTESAHEQHTRVAIVTGAAGGLGSAIALRLADDGFDIAVNDIAPKADALQALVAEIQSKGKRAIAVTADVASEVQVQAMITTVADVLGSLDVVRTSSF